jgi:acetylornithine deacetylase/succinyl-diaminopimelate desuccinylase-like protein
MTRSTQPTSAQVANLGDLCRIPSVSTDRDQVSRAAEWLLDTYGRFADDTDVLEVDGCAVGLVLTFAPENPTGQLTFYNYFDVTAAEDEAGWSSPPFAASMRDGRLWARGAAGNKGDLVARLEAVTALRSTGRLSRKAVFWLDGQEELGSPHLEEMLTRWEHQLAADVIVWNTGYVNDAGAPIVCCGFKGFVLASLSAVATDFAGHSGVGLGVSGVRMLLDAVQPLLEEDGLAQFESIGRAALEDQDALLDHSSESGLLDTLLAHARSGALGRRYAREDTRTLIRRALFEPTANIPWISGGVPSEPTRYAERAECMLDLRLVPPHSAHAVGRELSEHFRTQNVEFTTLISMEPYIAPPRARAEIFALLEQPLERAFSREARLLPIAPFSSPAALVADRLGAAVCAVGVTDSRSTPHGTNESIALDTFEREIRFVELLLGGD